MTRLFKRGDRVRVKATGYEAKVYDYEELLGETKVLVRFFGRHSLDLFTEAELEKVERKDGKDIKGHAFERIVGLVAPFSLSEFEQRVTYDPLRKGTGGRTCDYCGTYILNVYWILDANGKRFKVGSECVRHLNDTKLVTVVEGEKKKQEKIKREIKRVENWKIETKEFEDALIILANYPHPNQYFASQKKTLADYYKFTGNRKKAIAEAKIKKGD